jgi:hypothetical protein
MDFLRQTNHLLCERAGEIFELHLAAKAVPVEINESADGPKRYRAKIAQADLPNGNSRIYTRELLGAVIEQCKPLIAEGKLAGRVDHPGYSDGLKSTCILWKSMEMDSSGAVTGDFEIVTEHSMGADLKALIDAGAAIGFSTAGCGSARYPDEADQKRFDIPEDNPEGIVIINPDYRLSKIDAVDDPSVRDAYRKTTESASESLQTDGPNPSQEKPENVAMKTLDELKAANPDLFKMHEAAVAAKEQEIKRANEGENKRRDALKASLLKVAEANGISLEKEILPADAAEKIEAGKADIAKVQKSLDDANAMTKTLEAEVATLKGKIADAEKAKADSDRKSAATAKLAESLKDNRFAKQINKVVTDGKMLDHADFTAEAVEKFVKAKTDEYEAIAAPVELNPKDGFDLDINGDDPTVEDDKKTTAEQIKKEFKL